MRTYRALRRGALTPDDKISRSLTCVPGIFDHSEYDLPRKNRIAGMAKEGVDIGTNGDNHLGATNVMSHLL
jgi:hypothetical protein